MADTHEALAAQQRQERELWHAYAVTFSGDHGKLVLADLRRTGFMESTTLAARAGHSLLAPVDPVLLASNEGMRRLVLYIEDMIATGKNPPPIVEPKTHAVSATAPEGERKDG